MTSKSMLPFIITNITSGTMSTLGSVYIVQDVLKDPKKRNESLYHRIMLGMSTMDTLFSFFAFSLCSLPIPKGYNSMAIGNVITCDITAFIVTMSAYSATLYHCSLATFYLLKLKYLWPDRKIKTVEKWIHIVPWSAGICVAIAASIAKTYGPFAGVCWITRSYPLGCSNTSETAETCIRGGNGIFLYFWILTVILFIFDFCYVSITMYRVYRQVEKVESFIERIGFQPNSNLRNRIRELPRSNIQQQHKKKELSRKIMRQGILYSAALLVINFFPIILVVIYSITGKAPAVFYILVHLFQPLQGVFNVLIYCMPRFLKWKTSRQSEITHQETASPAVQHAEENAASTDDTHQNQRLGNYQFSSLSDNDDVSDQMSNLEEMSDTGQQRIELDNDEEHTSLSCFVTAVESLERSTSDDDLEDFFCL